MKLPGTKTMVWGLVGCLIFLTVLSNAKATDQSSVTNVKEKHRKAESGTRRIDMNGHWKEIPDVTFKGRLNLSKPLKGVIKDGKPTYSKEQNKDVKITANGSLIKSNGTIVKNFKDIPVELMSNNFDSFRFDIDNWRVLTSTEYEGLNRKNIIKVFFREEQPGTMTEVSESKSLEVPTVNNKFCLPCSEFIRMAPNMRLSINVFNDGWSVGSKSLGKTLSFKDVSFESKSVDPSKEPNFFQAGSNGALIKKIENTFLLIEGDAYLIKN